MSITLNNEDRAMPIEYSQVTITRRLYRDGESGYLLNETKARLSDIQLLLAQANVGQRSYSVIGQGMVDHILISSPEERKAFFDDATGVKQFQLKRHEAMLKLKRTYENLTEVEMLLGEIEPRLRSLKRQVSRLEKREAVEQTLREMETEYYGTLWWQLADQLEDVKGRHGKVHQEATDVADGLKKMESKVETFEKQQTGGPDDRMIAMQKEYRDKQRAKARLRDEFFEAQKQIELNKVRAQANWAPLPLNQIINELQGVTGDQKNLLKKVAGVKELKELEELKELIDGVLSRSEKLLGRLQRPAPEDIKPDPKLVSRIKELEGQIRQIDGELSKIDQEMTDYAAKEKETRTELFDVQRELRDKQSQLHLLENRRNELAIELARLEERQQNLDREIKEQMKDQADLVKVKRINKFADTNALYPEIQRLRYKLELIGGIDPEIIQEYEETEKRFEFLDTQVKDLHQAIKSTEKIIDELDEKIQDQSEKAFKEINKEFQKFFKILFGGGTCSLVKMTKEEVETEIEVTPDRVGDDTAEEAREEHEEDTSIEAIKKRVQEREDRVVGIDIQATPPGKKMKALNLLSGGERAMTSIALISAIMAVNPSPFVLLDEVDAALDEANTYRFAQIIKELAKLSQFIIVTHNRATMESADMLYGVTITDEGISNLLAVKLEEIEETATARR
ncbi:AAA family ATPase [Patescibacteria group bacterium]|nr:AAA family ATPase [Patescibacteria group bacterium]